MLDPFGRLSATNRYLPCLNVNDDVGAGVNCLDSLVDRPGAVTAAHLGNAVAMHDLSLCVDEAEYVASDCGKVKGWIVVLAAGAQHRYIDGTASSIPVHMELHRSTIIILAVAAIGAAGVTGYLSFRAAELTMRPDDETHVALGRVLYASTWASCHGGELEGRQGWREPHPDGLLPAPLHDAASHRRHHPHEVLFQLTKLGGLPFAGPDYRSAMPAIQNTRPDEDTLGILSCVTRAWPPEIRQRQDTIMRASRQQR